MSSQIDLSFPDITRTQKFQLDKEVDYSLVASELLKKRGASVTRKDT